MSFGAENLEFEEVGEIQARWFKLEMSAEHAWSEQGGQSETRIK